MLEHLLQFFRVVVAAQALLYRVTITRNITPRSNDISELAVDAMSAYTAGVKGTRHK